MRIFWEFDSDTGTFTANNTGSGYDVDNLQLNTLGSRYASDQVAATAQITVDLGAATSITSFALLGHNLVVGSDSVTLTYASDSGFTTSTGSISVSLTADNWYEYFAAISRQYWRVTITKALSANQVYAGRLVLGTAYEPTYGVSPDYQLGPGKTTTTGTRSRGGQLYSSLGETLRVLRGNFPPFPDADYDEICSLMVANSTGIPFIVSMDWENHPTRKSIYGALDNVTPPTNATENRWKWPIRMTEQK